MTGNTGNTGNAGNSGGAGGGPGGGLSLGDPGGGWFFPDRVNVPFVDDPNVINITAVLLPGEFKASDWSAYWYAWRVMREVTGAIEFSLNEQTLKHPALTSNTGSANTVKLLQPWAATAAAVDSNDRPARTPDGVAQVTAIQLEITRLVDLARHERADALAETLGQKDEFITAFMALLRATPYSRPKTYRYFHAASTVGLYTCQVFKDAFQVARPSAFFPALFPPIEIPGHASFPSGHATQAMLIARCAMRLFGKTPADAGDPMVSALRALAYRIAQNRERAGLHTQYDTWSGFFLARHLDVILRDMAPENGRGGAGTPATAPLFAEASAEWQ